MNRSHRVRIPSRASDRVNLGRFAALAAAALLALGACAPGRLAVVGPLPEPAEAATGGEQATRLREPTRIDFRWQLNEAGSRVGGVGVARIEPPYRARLDLFLDNGETVVSAAVVGEELRLPPGAPEDVLPPVELMWATVGVFRPLSEALMMGGDRLEDGAERLRYRTEDGRELHYEVVEGRLRAVDLLEGASVVEWVRLEGGGGEAFPESVTYRNLSEFRELQIVRNAVRPSAPFEPTIWDPRS
jgi:hypothetical protein